MWPHGTGELIDELKRVRQILTVADKIRPSEAMIQLEIDRAFEERFIDFACNAYDAHGSFNRLLELTRRGQLAYIRQGRGS